MSRRKPRTEKQIRNRQRSRVGNALARPGRGSPAEIAQELHVPLPLVASGLPLPDLPWSGTLARRR